MADRVLIDTLTPTGSHNTAQGSAQRRPGYFGKANTNPERVVQAVRSCRTPAGFAMVFGFVFPRVALR